MKPSSVKSLDNGARLTWHISEMSSGEERMISYNIKSKYSVLRKVSLSPAIVSMQKGNVAKKLYSNNVEVESQVQRMVEEENLESENSSDNIDSEA